LITHQIIPQRHVKRRPSIGIKELITFLIIILELGQKEE
jgi:hypothetical protein